MKKLLSLLFLMLPLVGCEPRRLEDPDAKPQADFVRCYFGKCEYIRPKREAYDASLVHAGDCSNPDHLAIKSRIVPVNQTAPAQRLEPELPVYEGMLPRHAQWELGPYFLFTEDRKIAGLTFFDQRYVAVTKDTMERWVAAAFKKVDKTYVTELHDCDDLAWELLVFLRREAMHAHPQLEHGLLAGMAAVSLLAPIPELGTDFIGEHALVLIRVRENSAWWLIEPATGKGTKLAEEIFDGRIQLKGVWF